MPATVLFYMYYLIVFKNHYPHVINEGEKPILEKISNFPKCRAGIRARLVYSEPIKYHILVFLGFFIQTQRKEDEF